MSYQIRFIKLIWIDNGDEIPSRTKDIIDKIQSTCLDRYGNKSYFGSRCDIENRMLDSSKNL